MDNYNKGNILKEKIQSKSTKFADKVIEDQHPIIITINYALGLCLSFIFFIIYKICNKSNKNVYSFFHINPLIV